MTYLLYTAWLWTMLLAAGELDLLIRRTLARWRRISYPEPAWWMTAFASACFPGLGQFLNGEPAKALLLMTWPFLTMFRAPIPSPWQMLAIKSPWFLLPAWGLGLVDALVVALRAERRRRAAFPPLVDRGDALTAFLQRRSGKGGPDSTPRTEPDTPRSRPPESNPR